MKNWRTATRKDFTRIIENTRYVYNKTLDKEALSVGYETYSQLSLFPISFNRFILELRKAGLKGYPRFFKAEFNRLGNENFTDGLPIEDNYYCESEDPNAEYCDTYYCYDCSYHKRQPVAEYILELQTGARKEWLPMIESMVFKKYLRKLEEKEKKTPCYNCEHHECMACDYYRGY